jgi:hypothetical protein
MLYVVYRQGRSVDFAGGALREVEHGPLDYRAPKLPMYFSQSILVVLAYGIRIAE